MKCIAITGISRRVCEDIIENQVKTIEIRSAHNIASVLSAEIGSCIFITHVRHADLDRGVLGIISVLRGKEIISHTMVFGRDHIFEEQEMTVARIQISSVGLGRVRNVVSEGIAEPTVVDVDEVAHYPAR